MLGFTLNNGIKRGPYWLVLSILLTAADLTNRVPLIRYVYLRVVHAPGMPGTFSPPPQVSDPDMHRGKCVTPGSLTSCFLWSRWRGKRSRHSWYMCSLQFCVSGKRPISLHRLLYRFSSIWLDNQNTEHYVGLVSQLTLVELSLENLVYEITYMYSQVWSLGMHK